MMSPRDIASSPAVTHKMKQSDYWGQIVKQNAKIWELEQQEFANRKKLLQQQMRENLGLQ